MARRNNLLIVDDEEPVRVILESQLEDTGEFDIELAPGGAEAINLVQTKVFDVVLLDIRMPGMSGIELYAHIIEKMPTMKNRIIIVTGDVMGSDVKDFLTKNNLPYLAKPFDIKLLKETIDTIVKT